MTQSVRIGWRPYVNVVTQVVNAVDADATAFITAAGITNLTQAAAINTLVNDLKTYGLWTKMKALYPMVGGSATSHKFNLKDPRDLDAAYRLVFNGGWTHTSNGALPNGTTGYADTKLVPSVLSANSQHLSYYSRTQVIGGQIEIGANNSANNNFLGIYYNPTSGLRTSLASGTRTNIAIPSTNTQGFFMSNRPSNTYINVWKNNSKLTTDNVASTGNDNVALYVGAVHGTTLQYSTKESAFASIGDGLTDTEATNFYNSVQKFQTTLGRQIGSPIVSDTDAQAFLNAAEITDLGQANAVNTLVVDLKAAGVWTKMKALYPFVGGTATTHKWNLKDPRDLNAAFRLTFNGGWTHTATGALPNGTTGYADTNLVPSSALTNYSSHLSFYSRTNRGSSRQAASIGSYLSPNEISLRFNFMAAGSLNNSSMSAQYEGNGLDFATYVTSTTNYFLIGNRTANNINKVYENGVLKSTNTTTTTKVLPSARVLIGALSDNTNVIWYDNLESTFASIGDGLTDAEATAFYTAVQKYQTSLGRQIGTPVLAEGQTAGLLETYSGAAAAYSLRKLRNGYVGFAIRVRRSSDNTEQDIAFNTSGGLDTVSLLAFVGAGNGFVTTWYDQSGNGKHAYQISASNQPRIVLGGAIDLINNKPSLKFTNGQMLVTTQNVLGTGNLPYSVYGVSYNNATADSTLFFLGADNLNVSNQYLSLQVNTNGGMTNFRHFWGTGFGWSPGLNVNNRQQYYYIGYDGSTKYSSVNNTDLTNTQVITINLQSPILKIGQLPQVSEYYKGYHQELILFNSNSSSTTTGVKSNINSYYSIY